MSLAATLVLLHQFCHGDLSISGCRLSELFPEQNFLLTLSAVEEVDRGSRTLFLLFLDVVLMLYYFVSRSSITRIKDQNLFQRDINQERKQFEASRDSNTPLKQRPYTYAKVPDFSESPKEEKEKEKSFEYGEKDESETESETETESSTEEESSEEEPAPTSRRPETKNVTMNSIPHKQPVNSKKPDSSESETESESEEEQKAQPVTTTSTRTYRRENATTSSTTNSQTSLNRTYNTPATTTSPTSRQAPSVGARLKSPFLDQDKDKKTAPVSKTETSKIASRFGERKDNTASSRISNFPVRTTASTTSTSATTTSSTTSSFLRNRIGSASSDKDDTTTTTSSSRRQKQKVTRRAGTAFVGNFANEEDDNKEDNESKKDKDSDKDTKKVSFDLVILA